MPTKTAPAAKKPAARTPKAKTAAPRRARTTKTTAAPTHLAIAERAYFIHLDEPGADELANWLRAERELTAA